jgi:hypothetical protein
MATRNANPSDREPVYSTRRWSGGYGCGWWWFLWFWVLIFLVLGGWGWWRRQRVYQSGVPAAETTPPELVGRNLTISGQIAATFSPHAFTLAAASGGRALLVVTTPAATPEPALAKGERVEVTGTLQNFAPATLPSATGVNLASIPTADFVGRPVLVASVVWAKTPAQAAGR